ncbi:MAG: hypothetical protein OEU50_19055 [Gammaproteobacteria bacterium]|nr:hypothetical protein [Gammaproteobacteria bacterium]
MFAYRRRFFICLALLLQLSSTCKADATYLQPDSVYLGDMTELVIEYDNSIPSLYSLDSSALEADFEIIGKNSRIFRLDDTGKANEVIHRMQWRLQLLPRRIGKLSVPELYFSDKSTTPLTLEVALVPPSLQSSHRVFVEMNADTLTPYLGQQTQIEMQLYSNTPVSNGRMFEPQTGDALVHRQLDEESFSATRQGQSLEVMQRGIALFPRSAGKLRLTPASFRGSIGNSANASQAEMANGTRNILRRSKPLNLEVRNPPPEFSGRYWLPARQLELSQSWNETGKPLRVGDSMDWTLTIVARGLPAESLPANLMTMESERFRIYADQPTRINRFEGRQMIGRLEQRFAVIANQSGEIVLPAPVLKWWDVVSDSEKRAQLEGKTFNVIEAVAISEIRAGSERGTVVGWLMHMVSGQRAGWQILWSILLLAVCLVSIRLLPSRIAAMAQPWLQQRRLRLRLKQACLSNDAATTRDALIEWGRARWPGLAISGLTLIDRQLASSELNAQLQKLDAALYSRHQSDWSGDALWRQISALERSPRTGTKLPNSGLPRLYPA